MSADAKRDLQNAAAVVSGGSSGLGAAVAEALALAGARVLLLGRNEKKLQQVCDKIGAPAQYLSGDVGDSAFCEQALKKCDALFGRIDILINNAGVIRRAATTETSDEAWLATMRVNLDGVFWLSRAAAVRMQKQQSGAIVNVSSTAGVVGAPHLAAYCASKGGVAQLTRSLAVEYAADGITVNAVCPGAIETPMLFGGHAAGVGETEIREKNIAAIPQKRIATPQEVARAIIFLATEPHITGALLPIDGGYTAQ